MAIRTSVTEGYGNGTFNGTIPLAVRHGYNVGGVIQAGPYVDPDTDLVASSVSIGTLRNFIETNGGLLLEALGLKNVWTGQMPPIVTESDLMFHLRVQDEGDAKDKLESWNLWRTGIRHPGVGSFTQYDQVHVIRISGEVWHHTEEESRRYMNLAIEQITQTLEFNKDLMIGGGAEITNIDSRSSFARFGDILLNQCQIDFQITTPIHERSGRNF